MRPFCWLLLPVSRRTGSPNGKLSGRGPNMLVHVAGPGRWSVRGSSVTLSTGLGPTGTVTFLFTDVEGSTRRWELDEESMAAALADHDRVLRWVIADHGGYVFSTSGDSFAAAFNSTRAGAEAAVAGQRLLAPTGLVVRMGLHVGEAHERDGDYFGPAVNRAARIMAAAHGGQILVSTAMAELLAGRVHVSVPGGAPAAGRVGAGPTLAGGGGRSTRRLSAAALRSQPTVRPRSTPDRFGRTGRRPRGPGRQLAAPSVITLTGVGGIGKTRLARQAAAMVADCFADGVCLVELASVADPDLAAEAVLAALGSRRRDGMTGLGSVDDFCAARHFLVVLDNCEHVLDAAAAITRAVVAGRTCAVLATSREPLGVDGERVWPVPGLADDDAVALFADRAAAVGAATLDGTDQGVIVEICRRLDGIPLAIELAAARVRSMQLSEILEHLDARFDLLRGGPRDAAARHRTLHAALHWSYDLLPEADRALFRRLAVFPGGCTARQAWAICSPPGSDRLNRLDMVDGLDRLVARSMLAVDTSRPVTRYRLGECLRQFGRDALETAGELDETRSRHANTSWSSPRPSGAARPPQTAPEAAAAFGDEWENLRAASEWFAERSDAPPRPPAGHRRLVVRLHQLALRTAGLGADRRLPARSPDRSAVAERGGRRRLPGVGCRRARRGARPRPRGQRGGQSRWTPGGLRGSSRDLRRRRLPRRHGDSRGRGHHDGIDHRPHTRPARGRLDGDVPGGRAGEFGPDAGILERAYEYAREFLGQAQERGNPYELATAYNVLIYTCGLTGRAEEARQAHWAGRRWNDATDYRHAIAYAQWATAVPLPPREALGMLPEAIKLFRGVDRTQLMNALEVAIQKLAQLECTDRLAAIYGAILHQERAERRWALYRQSRADRGELQTDYRGLEPSFREKLGPRLDQLILEGETWTHNELIDAILAEIDSVLRSPNPSTPEATSPTSS